MVTTNPVVWYPIDVPGAAWGYPNGHTLHESVSEHSGQKQLQHTLAWQVFYVQIWIRNVEDTTRNANPRCWLPHTSFYAEFWDEIEPRFYRDYFSAGVAERFCWIVEAWLWTEDYGWTPADHL